MHVPAEGHRATVGGAPSREGSSEAIAALESASRQANLDPCTGGLVDMPIQMEMGIIIVDKCSLLQSHLDMTIYEMC